MEELFLNWNLPSNLWPTIAIVSFVLERIIYYYLRRMDLMIPSTMTGANSTGSIDTRLAIIENRVRHWEIRAIKRLRKLIRRIWVHADNTEKKDILCALEHDIANLRKEIVTDA